MPAWRLRAQDDSLHTLHHVKRRAEYRFILAEQERSRNFVVDRMEMRKDAILAAHVVRGFDLRADGRTAQHELAIADAQQVSEIRKACGKLFDGEWAVEFGQMRAEICRAERSLGSSSP